MDKVKRARVVTSMIFLGMTLVAVSMNLVQPSAAQGVVSLTATPSSIFANTPTVVTFQAFIPSDSNLIPSSPNLLRFVGAAWINVGRMFDDGTNGDSIAGDNVYTLQLEVNSSPSDVLLFRASVGFRRQLLESIF